MSRRDRTKPHPSPAAASDELHDEPHEDLTADEAGGLAADDVGAAEGFAPFGAPAAGATPVTIPPGAPTVSVKVDTADLQRQIDELKTLLTQSAAASTIAPPGWKLVRDEPTQDAKSLAEQAVIRAELDKGVQQRTQEAANRLFPEGKHVWRCVLKADRNENPELMIRAANPTDATARYLAVCGINHTEHKVIVVRA